MKIQQNTLILLKKILPLLGTIILFVIVGQFGFGKIFEIRAQIGTAETNQKTLTQKLDILRNISGTGAQMSNFAVAALPDSNPSLAIMSQIKILAGSNLLAISELKVGSPVVDPTGVSMVGISFNLTGTMTQIESFVESVDNLAPISNVDKIKLSESASGSALGVISVKSFFAPFPTKVPAITQAIPDLTVDEQTTLQNISKFTQPTFSEVPAASAGKTDPFSH